MNTLQAALQRDIQRDIADRGGLDQYRDHALRHQQLKTVVRESHCTPVIQLAFNSTSSSVGNLLATVGGDQATVYDDIHMGDNVDIVVHFVNSKTEHSKGGALRAVAWVSCEGLIEGPSQDAWLAVAGCDQCVQILSVSESRVIRLLAGHTCEVVDLSGASRAPGLLLSLSCDGCVRVWDGVAGTCLAALMAHAHTAEFHPDGTWFVTGHTQGRVQIWDLTPALWPTQPVSAHSDVPLRPDTHVAQPGASTLPCETLLDLSTQGQTHTVDCIRFLPGDRMAVKTCQGDLSVWQLPPRFTPHTQDTSRPRPQRVWHTRVPDAATSGAYPSRCLFSACADGAYLCCGNTLGRVYVYHSGTGQQVACVAADKVEAPVRACGLSQDCRHLWAALGNGFLFRFEYIAHEAAADVPTDRDQSVEPAQQEVGTVALHGAAAARGY